MALPQNPWVNGERVGGLRSGFLRYRRTKRMDGEKKEPRHRVMTGLAVILPALTRLSLVGLLLSRAPLRFTEHGPV